MFLVFFHEMTDFPANWHNYLWCHSNINPVSSFFCYIISITAHVPSFIALDLQKSE